jgi:hypothetical protein
MKAAAGAGLRRSLVSGAQPVDPRVTPSTTSFSAAGIERELHDGVVDNPKDIYTLEALMDGKVVYQAAFTPKTVERGISRSSRLVARSRDDGWLTARWAATSSERALPPIPSVSGITT